MIHYPTSHADLPSLLELAEVVATCIPFLPPAGQKNIGRVVEQMALIAQSGPEWMPIDSAPRDVAIWAYNGEQGVMVWSEGNGWALWIWFDPLLSDVDPSPEQPTHWLPLPPPPKESE